MSRAVTILHASIAADLNDLKARGEVEHWTKGSNGKRTVWDVHFTGADSGQHAHLFTPEIEQVIRTRRVRTA